jgi:hypothetical protein
MSSEQIRVIVVITWRLSFTGFVGVAMVWFAATGYCIMANCTGSAQNRAWSPRGRTVLSSRRAGSR